MDAVDFAPIGNGGSETFGPGLAAGQWEPGDLLLTHGNSLFSRLIRFGEGLRIHGADRKYTWFNHAALVTSSSGTIVEALGHGVAENNADKYKANTYVVVHTKVAPDDLTEVLAFAHWTLANRARYGLTTMVSLALTMLTGAKFTFFVDGEFICSGLVARAMERTGAIFSRDPVHVTPADLAKYYQADPIAAAAAR